jgi:hypothetical protein
MTTSERRSTETDAEEVRQLGLLVARLDRLLRAAARGDVVGRSAIVEWMLASEKALEGARQFRLRRSDLAAGLAERERLLTTRMSRWPRVTKRERAGTRRSESSTAPKGTRQRVPEVRRELEALGGNWVKLGEVAHRRIRKKSLTSCGLSVPERASSRMDASRICAECRRFSEAGQWTRRTPGSGWVRIVSGGAPGLGRRS